MLNITKFIYTCYEENPKLIYDYDKTGNKRIELNKPFLPNHHNFSTGIFYFNDDIHQWLIDNTKSYKFSWKNRNTWGENALLLHISTGVSLIFKLTWF